MVDHGADAATVVANAATDITKGMMQISAAGLKQLFLLMYEGKDLKLGETNIEKLIKMIDSGDRINDITVPKEHMDKFVELSVKHGITYAVVENPDGKMVVYFPESQTNRIENVIKDIQSEINVTKEENNSENTNSHKEKKEPISKNEIEDTEILQIKKSLYPENTDSKKTVVFFDGKNSNHYVRVSQEPHENGGVETRCFVRGDDGITELTDNLTAANAAYQYEQRMHFEVDGIYTEKEIEEHINKVCADIKKQDIAKEIIKDKENVIDNILAKDSALNGSIYTIADAGDRKNMIVIYKQLEQTPDGEFKTVNRVMVFCNGELNKDMTPKQAILSYDKYKTMEKQGKSAEIHLDKIVSGEIFKEKNVDVNKGNPEKDMDSGRKPLSEYEKEVEKIKELEPKKVETQENVMESPIKMVKENAEIGR